MAQSLGNYVTGLLSLPYSKCCKRSAPLLLFRFPRFTASPTDIVRVLSTNRRRTEDKPTAVSEAKIDGTLICKATICPVAYFSHFLPSCSLGTRFAGRYCVFYRSRALYASMIYMLICYSVNCKTAKRCFTP